MNFFSWLESDPENTGPEVNKGQADFSALLFMLVAVFKSALQANTTISILKSCVDNNTTC